jgi:hypothetical protein
MRLARLAILLALCAITGWSGAANASDADRVARAIAADSRSYWTEYDTRIGRPMRKWSCLELGRVAGDTVFYPFSGPDLPTPVQLFPDADRYVLVSMQKAEPPPPLERMSPRELESYAADFRKAWRFYGALGFFRTEDLDTIENSPGPGIGVTGALMVFAVRLGFEVESIEPIKLDAVANDVVPRNGDGPASETWDSVRLTLRKDGRQVLVDYVRLDLRDGWVGKLQGAHGWIDRMSANPTLLKAASHLPEDPEFRIVRNSILWNAPVVVQDETGIDYAALTSDFTVRLYGKFTKPNGSFDPRLAQSLAVAYRTSGPAVKPLPFRHGYEKNAGSAMQVAIRKSNVATLERKTCS